jgi:signal transduction histidine kinase
MIKKRLFYFYKLLWLCLLCVSANSIAQDLIIERSYFEDANKELSFKEVQEKIFTPYVGVLSRGYTKKNVWIKLKIAIPKNFNKDDQIVIVIKPIYLDEITLYDPLDKSNTNRVVGDRSDFTKSEYESLNHNFVIPVGQYDRMIWLKLNTTSTSIIDIQSYTKNEMLMQEFKFQIFAFSVIAIFGMFFLMVLINWINQREKLYALFMFRQFLFFIYSLSLFGLHRYFLQDYLTPNQLDIFYSYLVIGATSLALIFEREFLREYDLNLIGRFLLNTIIFWSLIVWGEMLIGDVQQSLKINMLLNGFGLIIFFFVAFFCIDENKISPEKKLILLDKKIIVGYYALTIIILFFSILPLLGLMKGNSYAVNGLVYYTLFSGVIIITLMQLRANKRIAAQRDYENQFLLSRKEAEYEKIRREEQSHLMHMLMHELKNPLAVIEMANQADNDPQTTAKFISKSVKNMNEIIDRCIKADKLSEGSVDIKLEKINVGDSVVNFLQSRDQDIQNIEVSLNKNLFVQSDRQFFEIMLNNLLDNAQRYGNTKESIKLSGFESLNSDGINGVSIIVSNKPLNNTWPDPQKVFAKYYRGESAKNKSGTGLGLYLVRTLARFVGGDCSYLPDHKSINFHLWLPS